jgi:hypothetical protein
MRRHAHVIRRTLGLRSMMSLAFLVLQGAALGAQSEIAIPDSAAVVTGTVRSWRHGTTLANAFITLELVGRVHASSVERATTDSVGRFLTRVPVGGAYLLLAHGTEDGGRGTTRIPVHVRSGDTLRIDLFVPPYGFDPVQRQAQLDSLANHRQRWRNKGHRAYRATINWGCFCLGAGVGEWTLDVRPETTLVLRKPVGEGERPPITSIDSLFTWLEAEMRDPGRTVEVRYDSTLGYPTSIFTDSASFLTDLWTRVKVRVRNGRG